MSRPGGKNQARVFDDEEEGAQLFSKRSVAARRGANKDEELKRQEEDLDEIHESVKAIGDMSNEINSVLQQQNDALEDIDHAMSHTSTGLQQVTDRTNALVKKAGGPRPFMYVRTPKLLPALRGTHAPRVRRIIGMLVCVAFVLLLLVIYT
jgi:t-SNARE complex subunit (syntaxin)